MTESPEVIDRVETIDVRRASEESSRLTWEQWKTEMATIQADRGEEKLEAMILVAGHGDQVQWAIERVVPAINGLPTGRRLVIAPNAEDREDAVENTLYIDFIIHPDVTRARADSLYEEVLDVAIEAATVSKGTRVLYLENDEIADRVAISKG